MIIELKPEHAKVLERAVESGMSQEDALNQAFAVLDEQCRDQDWMLAERDSIRSQIAIGLAQAQRGELIDSEEAIKILHARRANRRIA